VAQQIVTAHRSPITGVDFAGAMLSILTVKVVSLQPPGLRGRSGSHILSRTAVQSQPRAATLAGIY